MKRGTALELRSYGETARRELLDLRAKGHALLDRLDDFPQLTGEPTVQAAQRILRASGNVLVQLDDWLALPDGELASYSHFKRFEAAMLEYTRVRRAAVRIAKAEIQKGRREP